MWLNNTWPLIGRPGKQLILLVFYSETAIYFLELDACLQGRF